MKLTCLIACLAFGSALAQAETYTYPDLVRRLTDLQELAKLPPIGEKTSLASSYDRGSQYDAATGKYIHWDANGDGSGIIRKEGDASVLADIQGPGCIWRIWSATPGKGHVKIYLDGSATPSIDLPFSSYFDGSTPPFNRANLVYVASPQAHGWNNYTPIPFAKSCKIVANPDWGQYYQFTYTQFPTGTVAPTFSMALSPEDAAALDLANTTLSHCGRDSVPAGKTETLPLTVFPGQTRTVSELTGPGAVSALNVKLGLPANAEAQRILLRQLTISITWDDEKTPAVWSPLGDYFCYVGGADKFQALPVGLRDDGTFYSFWFMPYRSKAHIEISNDGPMPVKMTWEVTSGPVALPIESLGRFHAKWHRDLPAVSADRWPDWTLIETKGRGRFVGTHLHAWSPLGQWWGEGDDKFFIDGEKFPSTFGTGSEDYFGYAWSSAAHFSRPYHNQILNEYNQGHIDDNRFHIADSVPFQTSFEGILEKYFKNTFGTAPDEQATLYAAEVFWYLAPGGTDPYGAVPVTGRLGYWARPDLNQEPGVVEGEALEPINSPSPRPIVQAMGVYGRGWSGGQQLAWFGAGKGATVELPLTAAKDGRYQLTVRCTRADDYGIVQFSLDGKPVGAPFDGYGTSVTPADPVELGTQALSAGGHVLKIEIIGKNAASKGTTFGIDYLKLAPVP